MSTRPIDRKAVVKLAQEAGLSVQEGNSFADDIYISVLYRFANLVASQAASSQVTQQHDWQLQGSAGVWESYYKMPVKLTDKMIAAALPQLMREDDEEKHRALGQLICVWDALIDAAKEEQR